MQAALGIATDPVLNVPDAEHNELGHTLFERQLVSVSALWGIANAGRKLPAFEVVRTLYPALQLFARSHHETRNWRGWFEIEAAAPDYFTFIVCATAAHGKGAVQSLGDEFERLWNQESTKEYWPLNRCHHIAVELYRQGDDRQRLVRLLNKMEQEVGVWYELHERAEVIRELAMAWHEIGELARAQALFPRLMQGTFGIYHRKDRQIQRWVDMLAKAVANQPDHARQDISRFVAAISVLNQTGRGRGNDEASAELIALLMTFDLEYAFSLFVWLLEKGGIDFDSALAGLLLGALRLEQAPIEAVFVIARHLYIPFTSYFHKPLAKQLAASCVLQQSPAEVKRLLCELNLSLMTKAWPNQRPGWWREIVAGLRQHGGDSSEFEAHLVEYPGKQDRTSPSLTLKDDSLLTLEEVLVIVSSYEKLIALIESVEKTEYFLWDSVIAPLIEGFTHTQVHSVMTLLEPLGIDSTVRNRAALHLHQIGHTQEALAILQPLLNGSKASGWDANWDGGSRLNAIKAMIAIDPKQWRPRALEMLIDDYIAEFRYPSNLVSNIEELAEILFESTPWHQLWPEIRAHVFQLAEFSLAEDSPSLGSDKIIDC